MLHLPVDIVCCIQHQLGLFDAVSLASTCKELKEACGLIHVQKLAKRKALIANHTEFWQRFPNIVFRTSCLKPDACPMLPRPQGLNQRRDVCACLYIDCGCSERLARAIEAITHLQPRDVFIKHEPYGERNTTTCLLTDGMLVSIANTAEIVVLSTCTSITDAGIAKLTHCRTLSICGNNQITWKSLKKLACNHALLHVNTYVNEDDTGHWLRKQHGAGTLIVWNSCCALQSSAAGG